MVKTFHVSSQTPMNSKGNEDLTCERQQLAEVPCQSHCHQLGAGERTNATRARNEESLNERMMRSEHSRRATTARVMPKRDHDSFKRSESSWVGGGLGETFMIN